MNPRLGYIRPAAEHSEETSTKSGIKTKIAKHKSKVKIFLEFPDEIEQFETGICLSNVNKVIDKEQPADDAKMKVLRSSPDDQMFQKPQTSRHISPHLSLRIPPPQNCRLFSQSPQILYPQSPYQTPVKDSRAHLNPHFNQNFRRFR